MPLDQFAILLDNPSTSYFPGQMVSGTVVIRASSEINTQGLKVKFEGKAIVHWSENDWRRSEDENWKSGTRRSCDNITHERVKKKFDDTDSFFQFKSFLLGDGRNDVKIPPGDTSYPFSFQLPLMKLPSSYLGEYGKVEYVLEAIVKRSWKFNYNAKRYITVNSVVDLNNDPAAARPGYWKTSKTFCCLCCANGPLTMTIRLETKGYCSGEIIPVEVEINNMSTRGVTDLSLILVQEATFIAQSDTNKSFKTIASVQRGEPVDAGDSDIWHTEIQIPSVPPTKLGGCRIIDVQYALKAETHVSGVALNLRKHCPIIIGSVPLRARFCKLKSHYLVPSAPPLFTLSGYPDLPPPQYQDSYYFKLEPPKSDNQDITNTVIDQIVPSADPDYVPKYVTYGYNINAPLAPIWTPIPPN